MSTVDAPPPNRPTGVETGDRQHQTGSVPDSAARKLHLPCTTKEDLNSDSEWFSGSRTRLGFDGGRRQDSARRDGQT